MSTAALAEEVKKNPSNCKLETASPGIVLFVRLAKLKPLWSANGVFLDRPPVPVSEHRAPPTGRPVTKEPAKLTAEEITAQMKGGELDKGK